MNLHDTLIKNGFKVTSAPDHPTNPTIEVTIFENSKGTRVIIEKPMGNDFTPEQARDYLFTATKEENMEKRK